MAGRPTGEIIRQESITGGDPFWLDLYDRAPEWIVTPMKKIFSTLVRALVEGTRTTPPLAGFRAGEQFIPDRNGNMDVARNINAAFLILLSGGDHGLFKAAEKYLDALRPQEEWGNIAQFMKQGVTLIHGEIETLCRRDPEFKKGLETAAAFCAKPDTPPVSDTLGKIWRVFFPEGVDCLSNQTEKITSLRAHRRIRITKPNVAPIEHPSRQILFLSNLLVTTPGSSHSLASLPHDPTLIQKLKQTMGERQRYWFDHPIQIGVANENNEALYGLRGLDNALEYEKERGVARETDKLTCLLSVSVTHEGLHDIVKEYLRKSIAAPNPFPISIFTCSPKTTRIVYIGRFSFLPWKNTPAV